MSTPPFPFTPRSRRNQRAWIEYRVACLEAKIADLEAAPMPIRRDQVIARKTAIARARQELGFTKLMNPWLASSDTRLTTYRSKACA